MPNTTPGSSHLADVACIFRTMGPLLRFSDHAARSCFPIGPPRRDRNPEAARRRAIHSEASPNRGARFGRFSARARPAAGAA